MSSERVQIPVLSALIPDGIKLGTIFVVEFDPEAQWFSLATTIAALYVKAGSRLTYVANARPREDVRTELGNLGVDVLANEKAGRLSVHDWYSATLGLEPARGTAIETVQGEGGEYARVWSLKVADLSVEWLKDMKRGEEETPGMLLIAESISPGLRFNDEKPYLEWFESRINPTERKAKRITLQGIVRGVHTESFYKRMEAAADGVIEVRVMERDDKIRNLIRVRGLRGQAHDAGWHEIRIQSNGEAVLSG